MAQLAFMGSLDILFIEVFPPLYCSRCLFLVIDTDPDLLVVLRNIFWSQLVAPFVRDVGCHESDL